MEHLAASRYIITVHRNAARRIINYSTSVVVMSELVGPNTAVLWQNEWISK